MADQVMQRSGQEVADRVQATPLQQGQTPALSSPGAAPSLVGRVLREPGRPLDPATANFMGSRFGHDLSQVRIHADEQAAQSATAIKARAYTVGNHVVFGPGQYRPHHRAGRHLLAHELTHTLQQRDHGQQIQWVADDADTDTGTTCPERRLKVLRPAIRVAKERMAAALAPIEELQVAADGAKGQQNLLDAFPNLFTPLDAANSQSLTHVKSNVKKIDGQLKSLEAESSRVVCLPEKDAQCEETLAFVTPGQDEINFCADFFRTSKEERIITVLHEVSHTAIDDGPDVYTQDRLFAALAGFPGRPGLDNPDSLAIFISLAALEQRSLGQELKALSKPATDKLHNFTASEEAYVRKILAISEVTLRAGSKEVRTLIDAVQPGGSLSQASKIALGLLTTARLFRPDEIKSEKGISGEKGKILRARTASGRARKLKAIRKTLKSAADALDGKVNIKRIEARNTPGIQMQARGASVEIFDDFFPVIVLPAPVMPLHARLSVLKPGSETKEQVTASLESWLAQLIAAQPSALDDTERNQLTKFLSLVVSVKGIVDTLYTP